MTTTKHNKQARALFEATFGLSLHRYLHPIFGFDVVRFDQDIRTPDGTSTEQFITQKYG